MVLHNFFFLTMKKFQLLRYIDVAEWTFEGPFKWYIATTILLFKKFIDEVTRRKSFDFKKVNRKTVEIKTSYSCGLRKS